MQRIILDANVILRFLLKDVPQQYSQAKNILQKAKTKKVQLIVPQIIIFEIVYALEKYYGIPKKEIIEKLKSLLATDYLIIQDRILFTKAIETYKKRAVDITDCFLLYFASEKPRSSERE